LFDDGLFFGGHVFFSFSALIPIVPINQRDEVVIRGVKVYNMTMEMVRYIHWQDEDMWLGYLEDYPDYVTQGRTIKELQENLRDIYADITGGHIPGVRKVAELQIV